MGVELVGGHNLRVVDGHIAMRTTEGYKVIDGFIAALMTNTLIR
ncbi:MAG: putative circularly permuted ATP-grasp superfamily protein [Ascidiaceihabitans sp.]